ncbi:zf-HC2 domain-containing protein [Proteiniborus sp. MB09-C3]|uniref:zf-HC2 domain-containing protein n=1 Tax=Proteiniborus sp. MB09-C3 TaxID=3050072 RepID=UPI002556B6ED|nr:zf-HC2 domain-containing protein [Proteiniborus sp. MB09-C3]WIV11822.1 hypothetical protein QO263_17220 [Proteiniborus sp. MB09-C3]
MNKCELVYDLLPNYINELTSPSTNEFIEEHLNDCTHCKEVYEAMTKDIEAQEFKAKDRIDFLGKIRKSYIIKLAVSLVSIIALMVGLVYFANEKTVSIASEQVTLKGVYKLRDGKICFGIDIKGADESTILSEGTGVSFQGELQKDIQDSYYIISLKKTILKSIFSSKNSMRTEWRIIDLTKDFKEKPSIRFFDGGIIIRDVKKAYYEGKDDNDRILIWEEGMDIPLAPEEVENLFK